MSIDTSASICSFSCLISIIIPTYNRPEALRRCLQSLACLDAEKSQFEVIVVDDGSEYDCKSIVDEQLSSLHAIFLRQKNQGPAIARNLGANHAEGKYLAFLDDDCCLPKDWLSIAASILDDTIMAGGHTINKLTSNIFSTASQELIAYLYSYYCTPPAKAKFLTSNNMIVPATLFRRIGGFSTRFSRAAAEDREFCDRWLLAGYTIRLIPEISVEHYHHLNLRQFLRQHFGYGFGASVYHEMRKMRTTTPFRPEPCKFYFDLILFPLRKQTGKQALLLSLLLMLSQVSNAFGYFWAKILESSQLRRNLRESA